MSLKKKINVDFEIICEMPIIIFIEKKYTYTLLKAKKNCIFES